MDEIRGELLLRGVWCVVCGAIARRSKNVHLRLGEESYEIPIVLRLISIMLRRPATYYLYIYIYIAINNYMCVVIVTPRAVCMRYNMSCDIARVGW